ncbi:MAG: hypothetical protein A2204_03310 [Elusimicrobia bacterium RIFOXYA1_FULL_47_7]|nr:MAG: hypothetical protein A2204_03310 [Elusimicrobia bacterium RIFOXYA1_FULL_47_7]
MIDVSGARVRIEEYIMRPAADQFKLVVLNEREDRFDYFYYKGTFNTTLPADLSVALNAINGTLGTTAPDYFLLSYEKAYSNTSDYSKDTASGGHLVKIAYNADGTFTLTDPTDPANTRTVNAYDSTNGAYDPIADTFDTTKTSALDLTVYNAATDKYDAFSAGQTFYNTRFNNYEHNINGNRKQWYFTTSAARNTLVSDLDGHMVYPASNSAGDTIYGDWGVAASASTYPDADVLHNRLKITYLDNSYEQYDNYIISDEGKIASASEFNGITTGSAYKEKLLLWNYQQVITATEFGSRKISLVVEPKILIKSGLIK